MNIEEGIIKAKAILDNHREIDKMMVIEMVELVKTLLTAYENLKSYNKGTKEALRVAEELEHQANKEAGDWEARCFGLESELEKEKEKNNKAKWKPIKDYDRKKYDWVLVRYFDGDYECVPEVAEKRNDGKWYTSEKQIPFEVKYFFDMQEILEED